MKKKIVFFRLISILLVFASLSLVSCNTETLQEEPKTEATEGQATDTVSDTIMVVRLKENLSKGSYVELKDIELVDVDPTTLPEGYIAKSSDILGRKVLSALKKGDYFTEGVLGSVKKEETPKTEEAVTKSMAKKLGYIDVTDFLDADTGEDLTEAIQEIIDSHPRKTIYFPDGVYTIARPIKTSSNSSKAVSLHFSSGAVLKAADRWRGGAEHMIQLGAIDETFSIDSTGTNYYLYGGVIDGNGKAKGVILEGGRETSVRNVVMKNVVQGFQIAYNEAYGSNDSDTENLVIEGCGFGGLAGVIVDGLDNTLSNIRVSGFEVGVQLTRAGNLIHDIHVSYTENENSKYENTYGFLDSSGSNWYDACRADGFRIAFYAGGLSVYNDCAAYWNTARDTQIAVETGGKLSASIINLRADFCEGGNCAFLITHATGGKGIVKSPMFDTTIATNETYKAYLVDKVVWYNK